MSNLDDKLALIEDGFTEEQAHRIVNLPLVSQAYTWSIIFAMISILCLIISVVLSNSGSRPWLICDRWVDDHSGEEYFISGYDPKTNIAKGIGPKGNFTMYYDQTQDKYLSSLKRGSVRLYGDQLKWGDTTWSRETPYY